jgi:iterative type I PKS product template protein
MTEEKLTTQKDKGKATIGHATCTIRFTDRSQFQSLQGKIADYKSRMKYLQEGVGLGRSMRLNQTAGYKLISTLAQFHPDYRAIDEVTLDSQTLEASTVVSFGQVKSTGSFSTHPAYIDVMTQTAGFVMNGKDDTDLDVEIFVNHGWESLQIYAEISPGKTYQTYVQMVKGEGGLWHGDTVMFDGDEIIAFFKGVAVSVTVVIMRARAYKE